MKKLVSVLILALVASVVFAGFSAGLGFGYDQMKGKENLEQKSLENGKAAGFSISADLAYEFDNGLYVFDEFAFLPKTTNTNIELSGSTKNSYGVKNYIGVGYVLPVEGGVKFMAGASFLVNSFTYNHAPLEIRSYKFRSFGFALNFKVSYEFAANFSAFFAGNVDFDSVYKPFNVNLESKLEPSFGAKLGVAYNF